MRIEVKEGKSLGLWDWGEKAARKQRKRERMVCAVCTLPMNQTDERYSCPHCRAEGHYQCFVEWLNVKGTCPYCRRPVIEVII
ncbi:MAG: hypothetical protein OEY99_06170 [Aigarchaeota archaeon]|nr:hypothetical protein [Aigarchaeota archaeon]